MHTQILVLNHRLANPRRWLIALVAALALTLSAFNAAHAAGLTPPTCTGSSSYELWAKPGTLTLADGATVNIWGYADTAGGAATVPGPVLVACDGDSVQITVHNDLGTGEPTSLAVHGHTSFRSDSVGIAAGVSEVYSFTAHSGTFVYQAGLADLTQTATSPAGPKQAAMGMYGALVVYPATAGQAYAPSATNTGTAFDSEALVLLSEIDPALNADPDNFDMKDYAPKYWLINGKAYPDTDPISAAAGSRVLLRYANAGNLEHSMGTLGLTQSVIAENGYLSPYAFGMVAETVPPAGTMDTIVTMPASGQYALFDGNQHIDNDGAVTLGGMMTFINVAAPSGPQSVVVTVANTSSTPQPGLAVYAFSGITYTSQSGVTDANGVVTFTLAPGSYNFRADKGGTQFFSGGATGVDTCTVPGCSTDSVTVTDPTVVTVVDTNSAPQPGLSVYAFTGITYTSKSGVTDANGLVTFTLPIGDYNFRADKNGTQFFSGGASGVNTCTIPGCSADSVTVTNETVVTVVDTDNVPQPGLSVYAFTGITYTSKSGVTDANGLVTFTLPIGDYNFRADKNGTQFFSGGASGTNTCTVPSCTADSVTVTNPTVVTVVDTDNVPQAGLSVYAYTGITYTSKSGVTDANGLVTFTLPIGDYNFRADKNGTQFFSGGASGVNTCTVPGCTTDSVTVTIPAVVTVIDTNSAPVAGVSVYAFSGTTYTSKSGVTDASGMVTFTLVPGDYNFRADVAAVQYFSGGASGVNTCTIPGCLTDSVTVPAAGAAPALPPVPVPPAALPKDRPAPAPGDVPPAS